MIPRNCRQIAWELGSSRQPSTPCDVSCFYAEKNQKFKGRQYNAIVGRTNRVEHYGLQRCADGRRDSLVHCPVWVIPIRVIGRFSHGRASVNDADWLDGCTVLFISVDGVRIGYIRSAVCGRHSTAAAPVTGSLVFFDTFACLYGYCAAEYTSSWLFCGTVCDGLCGHGLLIRRVDLCSCKTMEYMLPGSGFTKGGPELS